MKIRDMKRQDWQTYLELSREFYSTGAVDHPVDEANFRRTFDAALSGEPFLRALFIEHDGAVAGYALLSFTWSNEVGGMSVLLEELYIRPQFRSLRLGSAFIEFAEEEYALALRFRLEVTESNERAIALYERMGYKKLEYLQMIKDR